MGNGMQENLCNTGTLALLRTVLLGTSTADTPILRAVCLVLFTCEAVKCDHSQDVEVNPANEVTPVLRTIAFGMICIH